MTDVVVVAGRIRRAVVLLVAVGCVVACSGGSDADPAGADAAPSGTPAEVGPTAGAPRGAGRDAGGPSPDAGIGAGAARSAGVFSAAYDAALRGPDRASEGRVTLRLLNTGTEADSYRITVSPADAASMTPSNTTLKPGTGAALRLHLTDSAKVHVYSKARGTEVATLPIKLDKK